MALGGGSGGGARGIEAGQAFVRLGAKDDLSGKLKAIAGRFADFGKKVLSLTGIGGAIGGILGALSFKETADDLGKIEDVAKAFGITGKAASGLFGVLGAAGGEFKENVEGVIQFSDTLNEALSGGDGQGAKLFKDLSVTAKELEGMSVDEQFYRVHAAIRELPQPLQEAKLALLGGTDSMKQWQRLLSMSSEDVRAIADATAISSAELKDASDSSKAMAQAGAAANRVWQQTVIMIAPLVTATAKKISELMKPVVEWMRGRTLQDVWDELQALFHVGWTEVAAFTQETWAGLWSEYVSRWDETITTVKGMFSNLARFAADTMHDVIKGNTAILRLVDPKTADRIEALSGRAKGAVGKGLDAFDQAAQDEFAARESVRANEKNALAERLNAEKKAARDNLDEVRAAIEARRKQRMEEENQPVRKLPELAKQLGKSLGTFGAGSFLKQGFGVQSADVGQQMVKEQKKGNHLLSKLVDKAQPLVFA